MRCILFLSLLFAEYERGEEKVKREAQAQQNYSPPQIHTHTHAQREVDDGRKEASFAWHIACHAWMSKSGLNTWKTCKWGKKREAKKKPQCSTSLSLFLFHVASRSPSPTVCPQRERAAILFKTKITTHTHKEKAIRIAHEDVLESVYFPFSLLPMIAAPKKTLRKKSSRAKLRGYCWPLCVLQEMT